VERRIPVVYGRIEGITSAEPFNGEEGRSDAARISAWEVREER
jgi:hypothetical protein